MSLRLGSLFSGAGGLDLAIEDVFGAELRWVSDIIARDKHGRQIGDAPRILAHRFPNVPNLGDITTIDWAGVEPRKAPRTATAWACRSASRSNCSPPHRSQTRWAGMNGAAASEATSSMLKGIATQQAWGPYRAAIARWEALTRPAPAPTVPGRNGRPRLNPEFSEWMMGWPAGWVTDVPGMRDTWKHHAIGNGVVPQQAAAAIHWCLAHLEALGGAA